MEGGILCTEKRATKTGDVWTRQWWHDILTGIIYIHDMAHSYASPLGIATFTQVHGYNHWQLTLSIGSSLLLQAC
jgi:hypothetical protein